MNVALAQALGVAVGALGDTLPADWRRIVMIKNDGPIPVPVRPLVGDPDRGFNLLLLSESGQPVHYVRCRDATDAVATREAEILQRLSEAPDVRAHIPESASSRADGIQVLASRYMQGRLLAHVLRGMPAARWREALFELTDLAMSIGAAAEQRVPGLRNPAPFVFLTEAEEPLGSLAASGLAQQDAEALARLLAHAGSVARFPQHGDLWPGNVIRDGAVWRLLDFELFGRVEAPLFDACHLTYTSTEYLLTGGRGFGGSWIAHLRNERPVGLAARAVLRRSADAHGLAPREAIGALIYCFVEMSDRLRRRGAQASVWQVPLAELGAIAGMIRDGADLEAAFFGARDDG